MKKYFIIAAAAFMAIAACTKVDTFETKVDAPISFSVINHLHQTRATAGLTYPIDVPFGSFAWWTENDWTGAAADQDFVFMDNQKVQYYAATQSEAAKWAPTSTYYWTKSGKLTFASYSPYVDDNTKASKGFSAIPVYNAATGFNFADYSIVADTNVDLMYANLAANCTQDTNVNGGEVTDSSNPEGGFKGVPTIFNHALCQLGFEFRAIGNKNPNVTKIEIDLTDVDIMNIDNKGSFIQNPATETTPRWTTNHATDKTDYEYAPSATITLPLIEANATNIPKTDNYTALGRTRILMPQALVVTKDAENKPLDIALTTVTDQKLVVKYTIKTEYASKPGEWATEDVTSIVRLNNGSIAAWKENQNITYRISINPYATLPITFDPAVVSWTDVYSDNIDIIPGN